MGKHTVPRLYPVLDRALVTSKLTTLPLTILSLQSFLTQLLLYVLQDAKVSRQVLHRLRQGVTNVLSTITGIVLLHAEVSLEVIVEIEVMQGILCLLCFDRILLLKHAVSGLVLCFDQMVDGSLVSRRLVIHSTRRFVLLVV